MLSHAALQDVPPMGTTTNYLFSGMIPTEERPWSNDLRSTGLTRPGYKQNPGPTVVTLCLHHWHVAPQVTDQGYLGCTAPELSLVLRE